MTWVNDLGKTFRDGLEGHCITSSVFVRHHPGFYSLNRLLFFLFAKASTLALDIAKGFHPVVWQTWRAGMYEGYLTQARFQLIHISYAS